MLEFFKAIVFFFWENILFFLPVSTQRKREAKEIIFDLEKLKKTNPEYTWAADLNIEFVKAAANVFSYIWWLIKRAPVIRREHRESILELADLPLPRWQKETHEKLTILARTLRPIPDLLKPIREKVFAEIINLKEKGSSIKLLNLGCGAMELERQIIEKLLKIGFSSHYPVIFMGVDYSAAVLELVQNNLASMSRGLVDIQKVSRLDMRTLNKLGENTECQFLVVILQSDVFRLENLPEGWVDVVYHSRFKHHFNKTRQKKKLDRIAIHLASSVAVEYDDIYSKPIFTFPSVLTWKWITTLNGAILSYLRDPSKKELLAQDDEWDIQFDDKFGYYLRTFRPKKKLTKAVTALPRRSQRDLNLVST